MKSLEALENWYNTQNPKTKAYEYEHHYRLIKKEEAKELNLDGWFGEEEKDEC